LVDCEMVKGILPFLRQVRLRLPQADSLKLRRLQVEKFLGVLAALQAHIGRLHLQLFAAEHLVDFYFDRQTVTIKARNVGRIESPTSRMVFSTRSMPGVAKRSAN
jgi:hypothetical protein